MYDFTTRKLSVVELFTAHINGETESCVCAILSDYEFCDINNDGTVNSERALLETLRSRNPSIISILSCKSKGLGCVISVYKILSSLRGSWRSSKDG